MGKWDPKILSMKKRDLAKEVLAIYGESLSEGVGGSRMEADGCSSESYVGGIGARMARAIEDYRG
jgi:hypothetical protein